MALADTVSRYIIPRRWIRYDATLIFNSLIEAKTAAAILRRTPHLPQWVERAHEEQLRLEAVGTSRIEGAEFTQREQEDALAADSYARSDLTYSQRQLRSANATYRWLQTIPTEHPVTPEFILEIHRRMVTGCDDDKCEPGALRPASWNVTFGSPRCRGVEGGDECRLAFHALCAAIAQEFQQHDPVVQAIATHYHIGAMHPFGDGNGRTARALEAFMLRRAGVNDTAMVSLSNYYYEHKDEYLRTLHQSRQNGHNLTPFLRFALTAVADRCNSLSDEITANHRRILFREFATALFGKLRTPRRRALAERQLGILTILMDSDSISIGDLLERARELYESLKFPERAMSRDIVELHGLKAILLDLDSERISLNLDWPQRFSESELIQLYENMPSAASARHSAMSELSRLLRRR